jgi:hypothetical protein
MFWLNLWWTNSFAFLFLQTRLRVQLAPGFPCALAAREGQRDGRTRADDVAGMGTHVSSSLRGAKATKQSSFPRDVKWIASLRSQ